MDFLQSIPEDQYGHVELLAAATALVAVVLTYLLTPGHEKAVEYEIAVPEQCKPGWEGEVLAEPSIKVRDTKQSRARISSWSICYLTHLLKKSDLIPRSLAQPPYIVTVQPQVNRWA